jgi:hypothetical protein
MFRGFSDQTISARLPPMNHDRIQVNEPLLRRSFASYLKSGLGRSIYEEFDTPVWMCVAMSLLFLVLGLLMLPTIVWTVDGLKALWSVFSLEPFRLLADNTRNHPERLQPLLCCGVIIGPDQRHGLVVGSFSPTSEYSLDWLAKTAAFLAHTYSSGAEKPEDEPLCALLREDKFHLWRRRRVPEPYANGVELYLFDVEVDLKQGRETPYDAILMVFVGTPGEKGQIMHLPWRIANAAVSIRE